MSPHSETRTLCGSFGSAQLDTQEALVKLWLKGKLHALRVGTTG